jgi:antitoxin (DNA-binding transcriptional repressor) of toxin-antitoxin stability system
MTKNNHEVAKIIPIPSGPRRRFIAAGLLRPGAMQPPLVELQLEGPALDASPAIAAILEDRDQD